MSVDFSQKDIPSQDEYAAKTLGQYCEAAILEYGADASINIISRSDDRLIIDKDAGCVTCIRRLAISCPIEGYVPKAVSGGKREKKTSTRCASGRKRFLDPSLMLPDEVCRRLTYSPRSFPLLRQRGLPVVKIGRRVFVRVADFQAFMQKHHQTTVG